MTLTSRMSLASKVAAATAELQEQRSRRARTKDSLTAAALVHLDAAIAELCKVVEVLASSNVDSDSE